MNNTTYEVEEKLFALLNGLLPVMDSYLGKFETLITERSILATSLLLQEGLIQWRCLGDNDSMCFKDAERKAFCFILSYVDKWYREKYSAEIFKTDILRSFSHVYVNAVAYKLSVPLVVSKPSNDDKTAYMCIRNKIAEDENIMDWVKNKPNFDLFSETETNSFKDDVLSIANSFRMIHCAFLSIGNVSSEKVSAYKNMVSSFETVSNIFLRHNDNPETAVWNIQFAVEECLKLALMHRHSKADRTHNLRELYDRLCLHTEGKDIPFFAIFPNEHTAIRERYSCNRSLSEINQFYKVALVLCADVMSTLEGKIDLSKIEIQVMNIHKYRQS